MNSVLYKLNSNDLLHGAVSAIAVAILATVYGITQQAGFDIFAVNWKDVLNLVLNSGLSAFVGYLATKFLTDQNGKVFGRI